MTTAKVFVQNTANLILAFSLLALTALIAFGPRFASGEAAKPAVPPCFEKRPDVLPPVSCIRIGTSFITQNGKSWQEPIYAIMIGDTLKAEMLSYSQANNFGPWSLDAALYVRPADKPAGTWKKAVYRRPKNVSEIEKWIDSKGKAFYEEAYGDVTLIPEPFRSLPAAELAKISSIVAYFDGTTKVYLVDSVTAKSAEALLKAMMPHLPLAPPAPAPKADPLLPPKPKIPRGGVDA